MQVDSCTILNHVYGALNSYILYNIVYQTWSTDSLWFLEISIIFFLDGMSAYVPFSFVFCQPCSLTTSYCHVVLQVTVDFNDDVGLNS
jgi:hypothetical protein